MSTLLTSAHLCSPLITSSLISKNKKAYFDYEILDKFEAGVVLTGPEVKSIKKHLINLKGSFISNKNNELFTENIHVSPYEPSHPKDYHPTRKRKLLLKKSEINKIINQLDQKGLTIIPLEVYLKKGLIKILIGICKGRKKYDKREVLKKKSQDMEIRKALKHYR